MNPGFQERSAAACELIAEVTNKFGEVTLGVTGASMLPALWPGDLIHVQRCDVSEVKPGQVVLYRSGAALVAHRIVRTKGNLLVTRGDALQEEDPAVNEADILGKVVCILRNGRSIDSRPSFLARMCSAILRQSDFCLRMTLRAGLRARRHSGKELSWPIQP